MPKLHRLPTRWVEEEGAVDEASVRRAAWTLVGLLLVSAIGLIVAVLWVVA